MKYEAIDESGAKASLDRAMYVGVLVAALGYFVDIYDLVLFSVVRIASLKDLGVPESDLLPTGVFLLNMQMAGLLAGGVIWGVLGDKRGRLSVLFGSIFLYSAANIANGFVQSVESYALWRLVAGIGLAGELGAGITLVCETLPKSVRGYGTTIVATVGVAGAVVAALVGEDFHWRTAYFVGGGLGIALLLLRIAVYESGLFASLQKSNVRRGDFLMLLQKRERFFRYLKCILIGLPTWYVVGILITFSPEIGPALGMTSKPSAGTAILWTYVGLIFGDLGSGLISQFLKSRKKTVVIFIGLTAIAVITLLKLRGLTESEFYAFCVPLGFAVGYWAVFVTSAAEQFGTNLRATVATTAPNFVRGATIPMTLAFNGLKSDLGVVDSALIVGLAAMLIALLAAISLAETFSRDLDFVEE